MHVICLGDNGVQLDVVLLQAVGEGVLDDLAHVVVFDEKHLALSLPDRG
jgi:hypothetical protein